jgi:hypothetical protein
MNPNPMNPNPMNPNPVFRNYTSKIEANLGNVSEMCRNTLVKKSFIFLKPFTVLAPAAGLEPATL